MPTPPTPWRGEPRYASCRPRSGTPTSPPPALPARPRGGIVGPLPGLVRDLSPTPPPYRFRAARSKQPPSCLRQRHVTSIPPRSARKTRVAYFSGVPSRRVEADLARAGLHSMQILFDQSVLVNYRALSDTVFPGKPIPLGERVFGVEDPCPSFDSAASAHRMR